MSSTWLPHHPSLLPLHACHNRYPANPDISHHPHSSQLLQPPPPSLDSSRCLPPIATLSSRLITPLMPVTLTPSTLSPSPLSSSLLSPTYSSTPLPSPQHNGSNTLPRAVESTCSRIVPLSTPPKNFASVNGLLSFSSQSSFMTQQPTLSTTSTVTSASSQEQVKPRTQHANHQDARFLHRDLPALEQPIAPNSNSIAYVQAFKHKEPQVVSHEGSQIGSKVETKPGTAPRRRSSSSVITKMLEPRVSSSTTKPARRVFVCPVAGCSQTSSNKGNLSKHIATRHEMRRDYVCPFAGCSRRFAKKYNMLRHLSASGVHPQSSRRVGFNPLEHMTACVAQQQAGTPRRDGQLSCKSDANGIGTGSVNLRVRKRSAPRARWSAWELELAHFLADRCAHQSVAANRG